MKSLMLIGALTGFAIGIAFSLLEKNSLPTALWHACLGGYLTAILMRWWGRVWQKSLKTVVVERENNASSLALNPLTSLPKANKT